jgi:hypothetical protein
MAEPTEAIQTGGGQEVPDGTSEGVIDPGNESFLDDAPQGGTE